VPNAEEQANALLQHSQQPIGNGLTRSQQKSNKLSPSICKSVIKVLYI
jgi:hypothetical protein